MSSSIRRRRARMKFWEFRFGVEVEAPDSAIQELEGLARGFAGGNWGMEFDGTAMHFRFDRDEDAIKFGVACQALEAKREA
jgi:hypothetical protein